MNSSNNNSGEQNESSDDNDHSNNNTHKQYELTEEDVSHFKETFDLFDTDGQGKINVEQVKHIMSNYLTTNVDNNSVHNKVFSSIIKHLPNNNSNGITFNEFITLISEQIAKAISKDETFALYTLLFGDEYDPDVFRQRIKETGMSITEQEINEMLMLGDVSGNGKVSFDDFYTIINKSLNDNVL